MKEIDWFKIVEALSKRTTSRLGSHHISQIKPLDSVKKAKESFERIRQFRILLLEGLRPQLASLDFFELWFARLAKNSTLKALEIKDVRSFCLESLDLKKTFKSLELPYLQELASQIFEVEEVLSAIDSLITPNGSFKKDASEELYRCTQEKEKLESKIKNRLDKIVKEYNMATLLQDKYVTNREGRWVLPIKSSRQHDFEGIIHDASQSRQTVFMEPQEIVSINNDLRKLEVKIEEEIERLLKALSSYLYSLRTELKKAKEILLECDQEMAKAQLSIDLKAEPCNFKDNEIYLHSAKNPILILESEHVVPSTVEMDGEKRILMLSGPNAGGKTVLLKTIGLAAHMSSCGLHICAGSSSRLPFFKEIYMAVGDLQSISSHLSTFAAHLKVLNQATKASGYNKLLLIDEICGSTDPEEGGALARSFIEVYLKNQVFGVITSHLSYLKGGWEKSSGVINGSLDYDEENSRPLYRFVMGIAGKSLALQIAKNAGISESILKKAISFLSPGTKKYHKKIEKDIKDRKEVEDLKRKLLKETKLYSKKRQDYEEKLHALEKQTSEIIQEERQKARKEMDEIISKAKAEQILSNYKHLQKMKESIPKIISSTDHFESSSLEEFEKKFKPGTQVFIKSLSRTGIVQSAINKKGELEVLSQSLRFSVPWTELKMTTPSYDKTSSFQKRSFLDKSVAESNVLDVRGLSVENAIEMLEKKIDEALLKEMDRIKVVHGHGGEILKRAIRAYLSKSLHVKRWTASSKEMGGDGVTWVEL